MYFFKNIFGGNTQSEIYCFSCRQTCQKMNSVLTSCIISALSSCLLCDLSLSKQRPAKERSQMNLNYIHLRCYHISLTLQDRKLDEEKTWTNCRKAVCRAEQIFQKLTWTVIRENRAVNHNPAADFQSPRKKSASWFLSKDKKNFLHSSPLFWSAPQITLLLLLHS